MLYASTMSAVFLKGPYVLYTLILSRVLAAVLTRLVQVGELITSACFLSHLLFSASCYVCVVYKVYMYMYSSDVACDEVKCLRLIRLCDVTLL
jgi:hypothetical protein